MIFLNNTELVFMNNPEMVLRIEIHKVISICGDALTTLFSIPFVLWQCDDYSLWYNPNAERGARFYCVPPEDFTNAATTPVSLPQGKKIVPLNCCIHLRFIIIIKMIGT
jgi:hypothetical protein